MTLHAPNLQNNPLKSILLGFSFAFTLAITPSAYAETLSAEQQAELEAVLMETLPLEKLAEEIAEAQREADEAQRRAAQSEEARAQSEEARAQSEKEVDEAKIVLEYIEGLNSNR